MRKNRVIASNPKVIVGLSDPTVLLCAILTRCHLVTFHGPVVQFDMSWHYTPFTEEFMRKALFSSEPIGPIPGLGSANVLRPGTARGPLIGGNLTSLQLLLGTPFEPEWEGRILFWEDIFEQPHSLDAKLTHFQSAGVFDQIAGMVIGTLVECNEEEYPSCPPMQEIVLRLCHEYDFPILWAVNLVHTKDKITVPLGVPAEIDSSGSVFEILGSGVQS